MNRLSSLETWMSRLGGNYLIAVLAVAQVLSLVAAIPGVVSIQINAQFSAEQVGVFILTVIPLLILSNLIVLYIGWRYTPAARKRLDAWASESLKPNSEEELAAWREVTSLTWRIGIVDGIVNFFIVILPIFFIALVQNDVLSSPFQPTSLNAPDPIYLLLGSIVALLGAAILAILLIERLTLSARLVLLPTDLETQLTGRSGPLLIGKFIVLILGLILISILLIDPIGYQQVIRLLYSAISSFEVFHGFQVQ